MVIANYFYNVMVNRFVRDFNIAIKNKIIANYLADDDAYSYNDESKTLSLLFNDVKLFEENFTSIYFNVFRYIFWALMSLVFALVIDWQLALLFVAFSVIPSVWPFVFKKPLAKRTDSWSEEAAIYTESSQEIVRYRSTINEFDKHLLFEKRHNNQNQIVEMLLFKLHNLQAASVAAIGMTSIICFILPLCIGGIMVGKGYATLANLLAVFIASDQIIKPLEVAFQMYNQLNTTKPIRDKFNAILAAHPTYTRHPEFNSIELKDVSVRLDGSEVLNDVNLNLVYGDKVLITGESGSGKTVLSKCIEGYITPSCGEKIIKRESNHPLIDEIIYTSQDNVIFTGTYNFNVMFDDASMPSSTLTQMLGLSSLENDKTTISSETISGGQAKRINLARALSFADNKLLLLDEPFQGLSATQSAEIEREILSHNDFAVIVSHVINDDNLTEYNKYVYVGDNTIKVFNSASEFNSYRRARS